MSNPTDSIVNSKLPFKPGDRSLIIDRHLLDKTFLDLAAQYSAVMIINPKDQQAEEIFASQFAQKISEVGFRLLASTPHEHAKEILRFYAAACVNFGIVAERHRMVAEKADLII